jgi:hypothetical protein
MPEAFWPELSLAMGFDASAFLKEPALRKIDGFLADQMANLPQKSPFSASNCAEKLLGHLAYVVCRAMRPEVVVETGVAYGSMTTYLLTALQTNDYGVLHSIDLPSILDHKAKLVGRFVPTNLRDRWTLHLGASRRQLPKVLRMIRPVGLFIHDSLHTNRNMSWEFATVTPFLASRAVVLSDDAHWSRAFERWAQTTANYWAMVREVDRSGSLGIGFVTQASSDG